MAETNLGRVKTTHFDNDPTKETPIVDPYKPDDINDLNAAQSAATTVSGKASDKMSKEALDKINSDAAYQQKLADEGMSVDQKASQMEGELPAGTTLKDAEKFGLSLKDLDRDLMRIKKKIKSKTDSFKPSIVMTSLKYMKSIAKIVDVEKYKDLLDKANENGFPFTDEITESGFTLGIINNVLKYAANTSVWQYIEDTPLGDMFKKFVIEEALELAAKAGSYTSVKDIIVNYSGTVDMNLRKKCIKWLFAHFRVGDEDLSQGYTFAAKRVVSHFDYIYPDWEKLFFNIDTRSNHEPIAKGNDGILTLLSHHADSVNPVSEQYDGYDGRYINRACVIQLKRKYAVIDYTTVIADAQPDIILPA